MKRLASVLGDRSALDWARHHHGVRAARSRWRGREGMTKNDNYRGGDDNYGAWDGDEMEQGGA
jgi:hypothetical protein